MTPDNETSIRSRIVREGILFFIARAKRSECKATLQGLMHVEYHTLRRRTHPSSAG